MEWGPQAAQTALLAGPGYTGQAPGGGEKHIKRGAKSGWGLSSLRIFWVGMPSRLEDVFSFTV